MSILSIIGAATGAILGLMFYSTNILDIFYTSIVFMAMFAGLELCIKQERQMEKNNVSYKNEKLTPIRVQSNWEIELLKYSWSHLKGIVLNLNVLFGCIGAVLGIILGLYFYSRNFIDLLSVSAIFSIMFLGCRLLFDSQLPYHLHMFAGFDLFKFYEKFHELFFSYETLAAGIGLFSGLVLGGMYYSSNLVEIIFSGVSFSIIFLGLEILIKNLRQH